MFIGSSSRETVERDALTRAPSEACGVIVGRNYDRKSVVAECIPCVNTAREGMTAFTIPPEAIGRHCLGTCGESELLGFYHSHVDAKAEPSSRDLEDAWPGKIMLIATVRGDRVTEIRCWMPVAGTPEAVEVPLLPSRP